MKKLLRQLTVLCAAGAAVLFMTSCRTAWYAFHNDHGKRPIPFLHGHSNYPYVFDSQCAVSLGWSRGYGVLTMNLSDPAHPKFTGGVPAAGYITRPHVQSGNYGYYATGSSIQVVHFSENPEQGPELLENIPLEFPYGKISRLYKFENKLYAMCEDGLRIYDISYPGRPVITELDRSFVNCLYFIPQDGKYYRVNKEDPKTLLYPDGKKHTFHAAISGLFLFVDNRVFVHLANGDFTNEKGDIIKSHVQSLVVYESEAHFLTDNGKKEQGMFYCVNDLKGKHIYKLPPELENCTRIHSDKDVFAAVSRDRIYAGILKDGQAVVKSITPVVRCDSPVAALNGMVYGVSEQAGGYLLYGFDYKRPPYDGTPYDFTFFYPAKTKEHFQIDVVTPASAVLSVPPYLFAPENLFDMSSRQPKSIASTGCPAASIRRNGNHVLMAQNRYASVYDISRLPELVKVTEIRPDEKKKAGFMDIAEDGSVIWLLERNRLSAYDISDPHKPVCLSEMELKGAASMVLVNKNLYVTPFEGHSLRIIRTADPKKPFLLKEIPDFVLGSPYQILRYKNDIILTDRHAIRQFDISQSEIPRLIRSFSGDDMAWQPYTFLTIDGNCLIGKKYARMDVWDNLEIITGE